MAGLTRVKPYGIKSTHGTTTDGGRAKTLADSQRLTVRCSYNILLSV